MNKLIALFPRSQPPSIRGTVQIFGRPLRIAFKSGFLTCLAILLTCFAEAETQIPPLRQIDGLTTKPAVFGLAKHPQPIVLHSIKEAAEHFSEAEIAKLKAQVNFDKQILLIFAWRGSGQDKIGSTIAESFPEQITFAYTRGRTRDLRPHVLIYALRSNVTWTAR